LQFTYTRTHTLHHTRQLQLRSLLPATDYAVATAFVVPYPFLPLDTHIYSSGSFPGFRWLRFVYVPGCNTTPLPRLRFCVTVTHTRTRVAGCACLGWLRSCCAGSFHLHVYYPVLPGPVYLWTLRLRTPRSRSSRVTFALPHAALHFWLRCHLHGCGLRLCGCTATLSSSFYLPTFTARILHGSYLDFACRIWFPTLYCYRTPSPLPLGWRLLPHWFRFAEFYTGSFGFL